MSSVAVSSFLLNSQTRPNRISVLSNKYAEAAWQQCGFGGINNRGSVHPIVDRRTPATPTTHLEVSLGQYRHQVTVIATE